MPGAVIDTRGLQQKLRKTRSAVDRAKARARRDAGKQVRTKAKREIAAKINLPAASIAKRMRVESDSRTTDFRVRYRREPAHHFKGWRYVHRAGGRLVQESARVARFRKRGTGGLTVRFGKGRAPLRFGRAFRAARIGAGRVFVRRKGRARYPLEGITGPTPHGKAIEAIKQFAAHGRAAYERRARYWIDRYTANLK